MISNFIIIIQWWLKTEFFFKKSSSILRECVLHLSFQPKQQPGNGTAQAAVAAADEFEAGSVFRVGSKKQSLNHLLNFQFEPRGQKQAHNQQGGNGRYNQRGKKKTQDLALKPKYVKEQYLQAK